MNYTTYIIFLPQAWMVLGIILIIADIFLGYGFFVLPVGIASIIMSLLLYLQKDSYAELDDFILLENWYDILYWFSGLSIASIFLLRFIFYSRKKDKEDINDY